jgi:uncharacterized membrane protein
VTGAPQAFDQPALMSLGAQSGGIVEIISAIGDTLIEGTLVLRVLGGRQLLDNDAWKKTLEAGDERTFEQDPKYAIRLLVDIPIRALSPAINDPTTAVQALDQIQVLLLRLVAGVWKSARFVTAMEPSGWSSRIRRGRIFSDWRSTRFVSAVRPAYRLCDA